ncbi:hypothetical protein D3C73_619020 [compost metagenome]
MANLPLQIARMFLQAGFGCTLFGDVGMDSDPFLDLAIRTDDRHTADREGAVDAIMAQNPVLPDIGGLGGNRGLPAGYGSGTVIRMHGIRPAIALIFLRGLTGQGRPAGLFAEHASIRRVRPQYAMDGVDGRPEAVVAAAKRGFRALAGLDIDDQHIDAVNLALRRAARHITHFRRPSFTVGSADHRVIDDRLA